jgi:hypothetical protein
MKMSDILRDLAELMDQQGPETQGADIEQNTTQQRLIPTQLPEPELDDNPLMIPPLQQKLELLKKAVNVHNLFDQEDNNIPDELDAIKKNAGINPVVVHIASDIDPLD